MRIRLILVKKTTPGIIINPTIKTLKTIVQLSPIFTPYILVIFKIVFINSIPKKLKSKLEIIVTFLALLEMIRTAELVCKQKDAFGQINIKLNIGAEA